MELIEMMRTRRSVRKYTGESVSEEQLNMILQAGLLSASSKGSRPWEFIVVREKEMLTKMSACRVGAAKMLEGADCAVVVVGDEQKGDVWIEDCSIAMTNMHLMADSLGLGSCWIQGRRREAADGSSTEDYLRKLLRFPENYRLEATLSIGVPENHPEPYELARLNLSKIHREHF